MCGRTACTRRRQNFLHACSLRISSTKTLTPKWHQTPCGAQYSRRYNIPPTSYLPVLVLPKAEEGATKKACGDISNLVVQMMRWGLVPSYFKGSSLNEFKLSTSNARIEGIESSVIYRRALEKGQRCVLLVDGYFEWQTIVVGKRTQKKPFFIHVLNQGQGGSDELKFSSLTEEREADSTDAHSDDDSTASGVELDVPVLRMAAVYDVAKVDGETVHSFAVVTMASIGKLAAIHERMPAILVSDQHVVDWLDTDRVDSRAAIAMLVAEQQLAEKSLISYEVSPAVGNIRNQDPACVLPLSSCAAASAASTSPASSTTSQPTMLTNWLAKSSGSSSASQLEIEMKQKVEAEDDQKDIAKAEQKQSISCKVPLTLAHSPPKRQLQDVNADEQSSAKRTIIAPIFTKGFRSGCQSVNMKRNHHTPAKGRQPPKLAAKISNINNNRIPASYEQPDLIVIEDDELDPASAQSPAH